MGFQPGNRMYQRRKRSGPLPRNERYAATFARADDFLDQHVDAFLQVLTKVALGEVCVGKETPEGLVVYRVPPDRQALQYLLDRFLYKPSTLEDALLGSARAIATQKQVGLIGAQTKAQLAQADYTNEQTRAFQLSTITPEIVERVLLSLAQSPITLLQALTSEDWNRLGASREARHAFLNRFADRLKRATDEALADVYAQVIPATFAPDREEESDERGDAEKGRADR
jgi:hypothetical protein